MVELLYLLDIARSTCTTYEKSWLKLAKSISLFMMGWDRNDATVF